jgi:hypothetical protein
MKMKRSGLELKGFIGEGLLNYIPSSGREKNSFLLWVIFTTQKGSARRVIQVF